MGDGSKLLGDGSIVLLGDGSKSLGDGSIVLLGMGRNLLGDGSIVLFGDGSKSLVGWEHSYFGGWVEIFRGIMNLNAYRY